MDRARLLFVAVIATLVAAACGNETFDPMDPRLDGARLEILGSPAVNLRYGEVAELRVRYVDADGMPISNAPIAYEIAGLAEGSRVSALETPTTGEGQAAVDLTAGDADASFQVQVTPPMGDPVFFDVAVADTDLGTIVVSLSYPGSRELNRVDTFLFEGVSCSSILDPRSLPTALRMAPSASSIATMPAFAGVPVGNDYTVAVRAQTGSTVSAFGCRDGIVVQPREETAVNITLQDLELVPDFANVWDLDNRFDFGGTLPDSVETFVDALDELTDDDATDSSGAPGSERFSDDDGDGIFPEYGVDPGAFITDILMRQTCAWECMEGDSYSSCTPTNHRLGDLSAIYLQDFTSWDPSASSPGAVARFTGGCGAWEFAHTNVQVLLNEQVERFVPEFATNWLNLAGDLSRAINNAHILSVLTINAPAAGMEFELPMTHELQQMVVVVRDPTSEPPGMERTFTFALADAGFTSLDATERLTVEGNTLTIPEHSFVLNWGELVLYIYREIFLREIFGVGDTGELLGTWIDCSSVGRRLRVALDDWLGPGVGPDEGALTNYCTIGLGAAGSAIEGAIGSSLDIEGRLTIEGTVDGADVNETNARVGHLENGVWSGFWGEGAMERNITGTFTGTPRTSM